MLISPFRMYFVKKRVGWDLVDVHRSADGLLAAQNLQMFLTPNVPHQQYCECLCGMRQQDVVHWPAFLPTATIPCLPATILRAVDVVFVRCICCCWSRNPLNVSSLQSKRRGEPAWPAEFRCGAAAGAFHPGCCVCNLWCECVCVRECVCQSNLACVCVSASTLFFSCPCKNTHTWHAVLNGSADVRSSV